MKRKNRVRFFFLCLCFFIVGFSLVLPLFDKNRIVSAAYPTFGSTGDTGTAEAINGIKYYWATPAYNGRLVSMFLYLATTNGATHMSVKVTCALYTYISATDVGTLLDTTEERIIDNGDNSNHWQEFRFNTGTGYDVTAGTKYYLAAWSNSSNARIKYIAGTGGLTATGTYSTWPSPLTGESGNNRNHTMYVTYAQVPTLTLPDPADGATGVALTPTCSITVTEPDSVTGDLFWYTSLDGASWTYRQKDAAVSGGVHTYSYASATSYSTLYYWKVAFNDGNYNITASYHFTTMAEPRSWRSFSSGYENGGNASVPWRLLSSGYLTGGNITVPWRSLFSGYETGGNDTVSWQSLFDGYETGGNSTAWRSLFSGYDQGGNSTVSWQELFDGYESGGNSTAAFQTLFSGWMTGGNTENITLSEPYPIGSIILSINHSNITGHSGDIYFSINRTSIVGLMNTTIFFQGNLLYTNSSWGNGTIGFWLFDYYTGNLTTTGSYNWTVNCSAGTSYVNTTYWFNLVIPMMGGSSGGLDRSTLWLSIGLIGGGGLLGIVLMRRKK